MTHTEMISDIIAENAADIRRIRGAIYSIAEELAMDLLLFNEDISDEENRELLGELISRIIKGAI